MAKSQRLVAHADNTLLFAQKKKRPPTVLPLSPPPPLFIWSASVAETLTLKKWHGAKVELL